MFYYALVLLVVGLIAGALHLAGVSSIAIQVSWLLFLIGSVILGSTSSVMPSRINPRRRCGTNP